MLVILMAAVATAAGRPAHYDTQYAHLSQEERHRIYMMHVINQQFERVFEDGKNIADPDEMLAYWDEPYNRRLTDVVFHLAQWHWTPECENQRPVTSAVTRDKYAIVATYYNTSHPYHRIDAIHAFYNMIQIGRLLA